MTATPAIHLSRVSRKTRRILTRAIGAPEGVVPVIRHDGTQIGAVVSTEVAVILEQALDGYRPSGLLAGQTDPAIRARLLSLSGRFRGQYQGGRDG